VAIEYVEQGIRVNCLCPGTVDSPWVGRLLAGADDPAAARQALVARQPLGRLGTPEEVAAAALYLASDDAAFITGTGLVIDGGLTAR
jgi:NAD(P)-dependent dehydrogenase (short-subunit alcohol dehydrogenase family)